MPHPESVTRRDGSATSERTYTARSGDVTGISAGRD